MVLGFVLFLMVVIVFFEGVVRYLWSWVWDYLLSEFMDGVVLRFVGVIKWFDGYIDCDNGGLGVRFKVVW